MELFSALTIIPFTEALADDDLLIVMSHLDGKTSYTLSKLCRTLRRVFEVWLRTKKLTMVAFMYRYMCHWCGEQPEWHLMRMYCKGCGEHGAKCRDCYGDPSDSEHFEERCTRCRRNTLCSRCYAAGTQLVPYSCGHSRQMMVCEEPCNFTCMNCGENFPKEQIRRVFASRNFICIGCLPANKKWPVPTIPFRDCHCIGREHF